MRITCRYYITTLGSIVKICFANDLRLVECRRVDLIFRWAMSDAEGSRQDDRSDEGEQPDYAAPISALPPKVILQEESQMEVSASPAFQCLDEVSILCQMLILWTNSSLHSINIWDTVTQVVPLCSVYQAPSYESNITLVVQFSTELAYLGCYLFLRWSALQTISRINNMLE